MIARFSIELRALAALLVLAGGMIHWHLWDVGYRNVDNVGVMFVINVLSSVVIAAALIAWHHWIPVLAAFGLVIGTIVAFGVSRTEWDVLGFNEIGWNPAPEAAMALAVEVAAAVVLVALIPAVIGVSHAEFPATKHSDAANTRMGGVEPL